MNVKFFGLGGGGCSMADSCRVMIDEDIVQYEAQDQGLSEDEQLAPFFRARFTFNFSDSNTTALGYYPEAARIQFPSPAPNNVSQSRQGWNHPVLF